MSRHNSAPFGRGETIYNGGTIDTADLVLDQLKGRVWEWEDYDYSTNPPYSLRTGELVKTMAIRNVSGIALLPKRLAKITFNGASANRYTAAGYGYATADSLCFPIDEFLPSTGVVDDDLFWVVVEGPAMVLTDIATGAGSVFAINDVVVALTAASSQATTAGHVAPQDLTGATALLGMQIQNMIGRAMSAMTTAQTNASMLIRVGKW